MGTPSRERLAALGALVNDTRGAVRRGASLAGPGKGAPAVARDALAGDRVHDRAGRAGHGRTTEERRFLKHDVRGVASQVVGALEQIARNPGALDWASRRFNREGGEGPARGAPSVESGGGLGVPLLEVLGSFGGKSSGGHLSFCLRASGFFSGQVFRGAAPGRVKKKESRGCLFYSW